MTQEEYIPIPGLSLLCRPPGPQPHPAARNGVVSVPKLKPAVIAALKAALSCACHRLPLGSLDKRRTTLQVRKHVGAFRSLYPGKDVTFRLRSMHIHTHPVSTKITILGTFHRGTRAFGYSAIVDSDRILHLTILSGVTPPPPALNPGQATLTKKVPSGAVYGSVFV